MMRRLLTPMTQRMMRKLTAAKRRMSSLRQDVKQLMEEPKQELQRPWISTLGSAWAGWRMMKQRQAQHLWQVNQMGHLRNVELLLLCLRHQTAVRH